MNPERILIPVDIRKCPLEVFSAANGLANQPGATVTLLHVVTLNITAPEKGVYEALARDAHWHLKRLARGCLRSGVTTLTRVRFGKPAEEILTEAAAGNVDLIVLATKPPSFLRRLFGPILPRVVERVIREAPCGVFLTTASNRFNCEKTWGRPGNEIDAPLDHLDGASGSETSPVLRTEDAWGSALEQHRAVA
jgi:nucleotide-binding universal stress UspA family protein